ncbi:MAG TPA: carboxypeptidase-like regulatory domain-containing protein [Myxococcota bacterium]|nr:carboxypeptidase-like regulatory domain-containing protein [Myxococcota bacterium]HRY93834.1 carboxypeptidase-like regulatory domain-containing protein [Myxococcota bacterium]HSA23476.1 carboxypeptidase-like regulatory domain-containing protein [Myxococcota bacterium]
MNRREILIGTVLAAWLLGAPAWKAHGQEEKCAGPDGRVDGGQPDAGETGAREFYGIGTGSGIDTGSIDMPPWRCSLSGRVVVAGKPRSGIRVVAASSSSLGRMKTTVTRPGGWYLLEGLDCGPHTVSATSPRLFGSGVVFACMCQGDNHIANFDLAPAEVRVTGRVYGPTGRPVEGAMVRVERPVRPPSEAVQSLVPTNHSGRFELWLPRGASGFIVSAEAPGHCSQVKQVLPARAPIELSLRLLRHSQEVGLVSAGIMSLKSRPQVFVELINSDGTVERSVVEVLIRPFKFAFESGSRPGRVGAWHKERGWALAELAAQKEPAEKQRPFIPLKLKPGRTITGTIKLQDGTPVAQGRVAFECRPTPLWDVVVADEQGAFNIPNLPPDDEVHLVAWDDDRPWKKRVVKLNAGQTQAEVILVPSTSGPRFP